VRPSLKKKKLKAKGPEFKTHYHQKQEERQFLILKITQDHYHPKMQGREREGEEFHYRDTLYLLYYFGVLKQLTK
jgi:hypothetical protein